jgi:hypothetical protein
MGGVPAGPPHPAPRMQQPRPLRARLARGASIPVKPHRPALEGVRRLAGRVPLLSYGADYVVGLVETLSTYYAYTNGSN